MRVKRGRRQKMITENWLNGEEKSLEVYLLMHYNSNTGMYEKKRHNEETYRLYGIHMYVVNDWNGWDMCGERMRRTY